MQETTKQKKFGSFTVVLEIESACRSECDIWLGNSAINMMLVECGGSVWENEAATLLLEQIWESGLRKEMIAWAYSEGY